MVGYVQIKDLTVISKPYFFYFTSNLYPVEVIDNLAAEVVESYGRMATADSLGVSRFNQDFVGSSFKNITGTLKISLILYESHIRQKVDSIQGSFKSVSGLLRETLLRYDKGIDNIQGSFKEITGNLRSALISYSFYKIEDISIAFSGIDVVVNSFEDHYESYMPISNLVEEYPAPVSVMLMRSVGDIVEPTSTTAMKMAIATSEVIKEDNGSVNLVFKKPIQEVDPHNVVLIFGEEEDLENVWVVNSNYSLDNNVLKYTGYKTTEGKIYDSFAYYDLEQALVNSFKDKDMQQWQGFLLAIEQLIGQVDWVLDSENNQIKYTNSNDSFNGTWVTNDSANTIGSTALESCLNMVTIFSNSSEYKDVSYTLTRESDTQYTCKVKYTSTSGNVTYNIPYNVYGKDLTGEREQKYIPLPTVAQKVISNTLSEDESLQLYSEIYIEESAKRFYNLDDILSQFELNKKLRGGETLPPVFIPRQPKVIVNENTTAALDFENGLTDKVTTTTWNFSSNTVVQNTIKSITIEDRFDFYLDDISAPLYENITLAELETLLSDNIDIELKIDKSGIRETKENIDLGFTINKIVKKPPNEIPITEDVGLGFTINKLVKKPPNEVMAEENMSLGLVFNKIIKKGI